MGGGRTEVGVVAEVVFDGRRRRVVVGGGGRGADAARPQLQLGLYLGWRKREVRTGQRSRLGSVGRDVRGVRLRRQRQLLPQKFLPEAVHSDARRGRHLGVRVLQERSRERVLLPLLLQLLKSFVVEQLTREVCKVVEEHFLLFDDVYVRAGRVDV